MIHFIISFYKKIWCFLNGEFLNTQCIYLTNKYLPCSYHILGIVVNVEETMVNEMFVLHLQENSILREEKRD